MDSGGDTHRLRQEIERALRRAFDPADVLPRLARLARVASPSSDDAIFAHRQLAELLVERHPWRAAIHAKRALEHRPGDDRAWAVLAFCQTLLGNFRCAAAAYKQAIVRAPGNPWYAHNLGHLLDVALAAPERALPWLKSAYGAKSDNTEIVASYVHALARAGQQGLAREVLERTLGKLGKLGAAREAARELEALLRWLDQGAPARPASSGRLATGGGAEAARESSPDVGAAADADAHARLRSLAARAPRRRGRPLRGRGKLARVLERGMLHLPLDEMQRARALLLARDATEENEDLAGLAAAVAYAIVYVDHVPLSQAEVAAPFRVAVARLRGRFAELRAKLDLIPGDARYATTRV